MVPYTEVRAWGRAGLGYSYLEFCFGHVKLEVPARHLNGVK